MKARHRLVVASVVAALAVVGIYPREVSAGIGQIAAAIASMFGAPVQVQGTPTNGQALVYQASTGTWVAGSPTAGVVSQIVAGAGISVSPAGGTGVVTVTNTSASLQGAYNGGNTILETLVGGQVGITGAAGSSNGYVLQLSAGNVTQNALSCSSTTASTGDTIAVLLLGGSTGTAYQVLSGGLGLGCYASQDGSNAAVSAAAEGRLRYNNTTGTWQVSTQGGAYTSLATGSPGLSAVLATSNGSGAHNINMASGQVVQWNADAGFSRLGPASFAIGNGSNGDTSGIVQLDGVGLGQAAAVGFARLGSGTNGIQIQNGFTQAGSTHAIQWSQGNPVNTGCDLSLGRDSGGGLALTAAGSGLTTIHIDSADGQMAAVSAANHGRIRYNANTQAWEQSSNGAAYAGFGGGAASLQASYNGGATITEAGGVGIVISSVTADNSTVLTVNKAPSGPQSGGGIFVNMGANTTGTGVSSATSGTGYAGIFSNNGTGSTAAVLGQAGAGGGNTAVFWANLTGGSGAGYFMTVNGGSGLMAQWQVSAVDKFDVTQAGVVELPSGGSLAFSSTTAASGSLDTGVARVSSSVVCATQGSGTTANGTFSAAQFYCGVHASVSSATVLDQTATFWPVTGTTTVTLPDATGLTGVAYVVKNNGVATVTITTVSGQTIDGASSKTLTIQYSSFTFISDGSNWEIY